MFKIYNQQKNNKLGNAYGIGLVEVILALGVAIISITALVSMSIFSTRASLEAKLSLRASELGKQQLELIRAYRDTNAWSDATSYSFVQQFGMCNECYMDGTSLQTGSKTTSDGITYSFKSEAESVPAGEVPDVVNVTVHVSWMVGNNARDINLYSSFSNWQEL